jgi:hypothetical protein
MRLPRSGVLAAAAGVLAALALGRCGGGDRPTAPAAPTAPPVTGPTPESPVSASCERLPLGSPTYTCRDEGAEFLGEVSDAIDALKVEHPAYFRDGDYVTNIGAYYVGLIRILDRRGLCAAYDGEELAVKRTNDYSEQYKVLTSWNQIRRTYMGTCTPAWFPVARSTPAPSPPGCSLPPSTEVACGRPDSLFLGDAEAAIEQVMKQKPELFDFEQTAPGSDWPLVKDLHAYQLAVVDALVGKGYCAKFDGEEIQVKRSNEFSEHYDVNLSDKYVRRGAGIFRGSCYPAAF